MSHNQPATPPATEPGKSTGKGKSVRFGQVFWLAFLVLSLAYAWYSFYAPSNDITWAKDYTEAQQVAEASGQPIILFFTGKWCSPCQIMKRQVWADEQVETAVNAAFIPVTIDVDNPSSAEILRRYGVGATPTTILTDSAGNVLQQKSGGMSKEAFLEFLATVASPTVDGR